MDDRGRRGRGERMRGGGTTGERRREWARGGGGEGERKQWERVGEEVRERGRVDEEAEERGK